MGPVDNADLLHLPRARSSDSVLGFPRRNATNGICVLRGAAGMHRLLSVNFLNFVSLWRLALLFDFVHFVSRR